MIRFLALLSIAFLIPSTIVHAAPLEISETDKPVFAFFKLSGAVPNYKRWVEGLPRYLDSDSSESKEIVVEEETTRLRFGFDTYNVKNDFPKIATNITLELKTDEKGVHSLKFTLPGKQAGEPPYFPYAYGEESIALVVSDLDKFSVLPIQPKDQKRVSLLFSKQKTIPGVLKLHVRPLSADDKAPLRIKNTDFWILGGDTAYLTLEGVSPRTGAGNGDILASYSAPWYLSKSQSELLDILQ